MDKSADFPGPGAQKWQPPRAVAAGAGVLAAAAVGWAALAAGMDQVVAGAVAVVAVAVLPFTARRRLTAGPAGIAVRGVLSTRRWLWSDVEAVALATQQRLGLTSTTVELDLGEEVLVFGRFDLDADPQAVHDALLRWYTA
ncbi:PH domain-containing protein [Nakamurella flava]|uniref:PH domain-containing protein n=1 Tax=Nakamurella flava TaxID=2576308 RepID=A0A4U6QAF7_9ACTN|nr:PH domain-containing protein [Nakamurella flava]TKV56944.1 PH domain-containing protein [Nakamurella flava]